MPKKFNPKFEAVGSFIQYDGEIILLHRQNHKPQGDTWGIPSGKRDNGENPLDTACRETAEETGVVIPRDEMKFFSTIYIRFANYDFVYHMYHAKLDSKPEIKINESEHKAAKWISPKDALSLPLIEDLDACMELFFGI
jgi:8-oxo-dGTP pyrophosphatase MutT (NUDIX family)